MAGLEVIVDAILSEAKAKADGKKAEAEKRIEEINAEYAEEIEKVRKSEELARDARVAAFYERCEAERAAYEREMLLKTERETATELILAAKEKILNMPKDAYFAYLAEIYKNQNDVGGGEVLLFGEDKKNMPEGFLESLGEGMTLSDSEAETKGLIVKRGRVYINCTIDAIFREKESELYDIAAQKE